MADDIAVLGIEVNTRGLLNGQRELNRYAATGERTESRVSSSTKSMSSSYMALGLAVGAVAAATAALNKIVSVAREFDVLNAQLITATGSAENASVAFDAIQRFAATTPFDLAQATKAFTQLVNLGLTPSEAAMTSYGNTASAMGKDLSQMVEAVADATVGEFERLKEFGIKSKTQGNDISFTFQGVTKTVKKEAGAIEGYLMALGNNQFAGAMAERTKTLDGAISNLGDSWNGLFLTISKQGFSDSMTEGVAIASAAITDFDYLIGSGSLAAKILAIGDYFSLMASDVEQSFHLISAVIGDDINVLGNDFKNAASSFGDGLLNFPQMLRFAVASSTVYLASMVDEAKVYGDLFVETLSLSFQKMVDKAKVYGIAIGNSMNPFSDDYDFQGEMITLEQGYAHLEKSATGAAQERYDTIAEIRNGMINGFALEGSAATELFNKKMKQSDSLLDQYRKEKEAKKSDSLGQFKLNGGDKSQSSVDDKSVKAYEKQVQALKQMQKELGMTSSQLFIFREQQKSLANKDLPAVTAAITRQAESYLEMKNVVDFNETITALEELSEAQKLSADEHEIYAARKKAAEDGLTSEQITAIEQRIRGIQKERAAIKEETDYSGWLMSLNETVGQASALEQEIVKIQKAMASGDLNKGVGEKNIKLLKKQMEDLKEVAANPFDQMIAGANEAASAMSGMFESGSKDAQKMGVAMAALNVIAGVGAILNQGAQGDFVSVWGRMAAMAGYVVSLGVAVGGMSSGFSDSAAENQESQGLNVWGEKSESIANAIDITASATEKLVGINTKMLAALKTMQLGIASASGMIAGGAGGVTSTAGGDVVGSIIDNLITGPMSTITSFMKKFTGDFLGIGEMVMGWAGGLIDSTIGKWLGGSSKITDSGIKILGGTISEIISGASVFAYQETQYKKWKFGSKKTQTDFAEMDEASKQVSLIFDSLATSVYEGGVALGMNGELLEDAINNFKIEEIKISLKDLSVEDQQAEIESVFSKIFDDLAGSVIPFIDKFQQVGEGLGETLSRVATQVSIADFAVKNLGVELGDKLANPELFATIADNLSTLTGGIESFADKVSSFVNDFAPESVKFTMYSDALKESLESVGLSVPNSSEAFYALMTTLDGTTEEGQKQIAALLNAQSAANGYYDLLEDRQSEINSFNDSLKSLSSTLRSAVVSIYGTSTQASNIALDSALAAARIGDFSKALGLNLSNINPQEANFSTLESFNIEQAKTANKLAALADLTAQTATVEDMMLTNSDEQVTLLSSINDTLSSGYAPTVSTTSSNSDLVIELQALRAELVDIKAATSVTAKKATSSDDTLNIIRRGGLDVRVAS